MAEGKLYFAYGSNINLDQMAQRCPDAQVVGPVTLENYELLFRGNLRGAGVATIAPREGSTVHGLLWNITPECERSLDYYEGYCEARPQALMRGRQAFYAFRIDTGKYRYYLRFFPQRELHKFFIFCYQTDRLREDLPKPDFHYLNRRRKHQKREERS